MSIATKDIRNVVFLGHSGSGKTTFIETMLFESGVIPRRGSVENHNTISDFTDLEHERENTLYSHLMHVKWHNNKININNNLKKYKYHKYNPKNKWFKYKAYQMFHVLFIR